MTWRATPASGLAFVTGASSGIGRGVALELARRGYTVAATARRAAELDRLCADAAGLKGSVISYPGDVTDRAGMAALIAAIEAAHGPVALAFLNVGTYTPDDAGTFGGDGFRATFDINVIGTINCLGPLLAAMRPRGCGQIAVNASVAGYGPLPRATAYGASKAALINMAGSLRFAAAPEGITIQVVNPGFVRTPMTDNNDFPMPFLVELDDAARRICDGFERSGFEITFPRRLSWILKALNLLPWPLYFALVGRGTGAGKAKV